MRERKREREMVFSAKAFLDTAGSFFPALFIKVVVLRLSAHTWIKQAQLWKLHGHSLSPGLKLLLAGRVRVFDMSCYLNQVLCFLLSTLDCWSICKHEPSTLNRVQMCQPNMLRRGLSHLKPKQKKENKQRCKKVTEFLN